MAEERAELRIGVLSDTHGLLRPEALEHLRGADHIIHAGDIGASRIIDALGAIAPTTAIRGNVDTAPWAAGIPETVTIHLAGLRIHVLHDRKTLDPRTLEDGVDVVISGHSHRPGIERSGGVLFLNPGSAGPRRFRLPVTAATLHFGPDGLRPEVRAILP